MRRLKAIVSVWAVCVAFVSLPLLAQSTTDPNSHLIIRDPSNVLGAGTLVVLRPSATQSIFTVAEDFGNNGSIERIHFYVHDPASPNPDPRDIYVYDWEVRFTRSTGLTSGSIPTGPGSTDLALMGAHLNGRRCTAQQGSLTALSELEYSPNAALESIDRVTRVRGAFSYRCPNEALITGEFYFARTDRTDDGDDGGDDGDDDGGGDDVPEDEPEPAPVVPFEVNLPTELGIAPLGASNASSHTVEINTTTHETFNSDIHLAVLTNAGEFSDFHAEITPSVIAAPGAGTAKLTIRTGPLTMPRDYIVTVYAISGDVVRTSSFIVRVECTPPFLLGIDQPKSVAAAAAGQVRLDVKPGGSGPFVYEWFRGFRGSTRDPVTATGANVTVPNDSSSYWVRVRNACGSVDSEVVRASVP